MKQLLKFALAVSLTISSFNASASLLTIVGGNVLDIPSAIPNMNNFEGDFPLNQTYNVGGNLQANSNIVIEYVYLGHEANFDNHFVVGNSVISTSAQSPFLKCANHTCDITKPKNNVVYSAPTIWSSASAGQWLDFSFWTQTNFNLVKSVTNGSNFADQSKYDFATALNTTWHSIHYDAFLFLDDTGKSSNGKDDDNHDDMLIGVNVYAVSEPTTLILICLGLLGLAGARRFKA